MSRFNSTSNNGSSSSNLKSESNYDNNGIYTTPTSAKEEQFSKENSTDGPTIVVTPTKDNKEEMILMKSVKFKIDIVPSDENSTFTKVVFTQQQGINNLNIKFISKFFFFFLCLID